MKELRDLIITGDDMGGVTVSERDGDPVAYFFWKAESEIETKFNARELAGRFIEDIIMSTAEGDEELLKLILQDTVTTFNRTGYREKVDQVYLLVKRANKWLKNRGEK